MVSYDYCTTNYHTFLKVPLNVVIHLNEIYTSIIVKLQQLIILLFGIVEWPNSDG